MNCPMMGHINAKVGDSEVLVVKLFTISGDNLVQFCQGTDLTSRMIIAHCPRPFV